MNAKIRALLWEEVRTGGVIAAWCTGLAAILLLGIRGLEHRTSSWQYLELEVMPVALGAVVLTVFLLLYRIGNSGHLLGGFSGRILLLPVETWRAVGLILALRCGLILVMSALIGGLTHGLFGHGPAVALVLLLPALYLIVQALDWLRSSFALAAAAGFASLLVAGLVLWLAYGVSPADLDTMDVPLGLAALVLLLAAAVSFGLSIAGVRQARCGERFHRGITPLLGGGTLPTPGWPGASGFRSPREALFWWHFRRDVGGIVFGALKASVVVFFCAAVVVYILPDSNGYLPLRYANLYTLAEWLPLLLLPPFALLWGFFRGSVGFQHGERPSLLQYLYPVGAADMATARLACYGVGLLVAWGIAVAISTLGFLWSDGALPLRIYAGALDAGYTSYREILASRFLLPCLILLLSWSLLAIGTRLYAWTIGMMFFGWVCIGTYYALFNEWPLPVVIVLPVLLTIGIIAGGTTVLWRRTHSAAIVRTGALWFVPYVLAIVSGMLYDDPAAPLAVWAAALLIAAPIAALVWGWWRGIVSARHLAVCAAVWGVVVLGAYPFGQWRLSGIDRQSLLFALALGGLAVLPFPALVLDLHRRRHQEDTEVTPEDSARRAGGHLPPGLRVVLGAGAGLLLLAVAWMRWPAEPSYIEAVRAQGEPATLPDLAATYELLPESENGALRFLSLFREDQRLRHGWRRWLGGQGAEQMEDARDNPLAQGSLDINYNEPVGRADWELALAYREQVVRPLSDAIREATATTYPHSRFPIDIGSGYSVGLPHLSQLRNLARTAYIAAWMAAAEDKPAEALAALESMIPIAESLREEPLLISQLTRTAIHGITAGAVEQVLSRTELSDGQLASLQHSLETALPPAAEQSIIMRGLRGERVMSTSSIDAYARVMIGFGQSGILTKESFLDFSRITLLESWDAMEENDTRQDTELLQAVQSARNPRFAMPATVLPALDGSREAEWRCRTTLELAALACAVERFRSGAGALPGTLEDLVPEYIDAVPADPYRPDGGPLSYKPEAEGSYVLYTWGVDGEDDGGDNTHLNDPQKRGRDSSAWYNGDWLFCVASPAFRDGPQITDTPPVDEDTAAERRQGRMRIAE